MKNGLTEPRRPIAVRMIPIVGEVGEGGRVTLFDRPRGAIPAPPDYVRLVKERWHGPAQS